MTRPRRRLSTGALAARTAGLLLAALILTAHDSFCTIAQAAKVSGGSAMAPIPGHVLPALATAKPAGGSIAAETPQSMTLTIVLKRDDQAGFEGYLRDVYDPLSANFHRFLSVGEMAARFGPTRSDYESIAGYLKARGFELIDGSPNRMTMTVRARRSAIERTIGVKVAEYQIDKQTFYANDRDPMLPDSIAAHIEAIVGLSNLARPIRIGSAENIVDSLPKGTDQSGTVAESCEVAWHLDEEGGVSGGASLAAGMLGLETAPLDISDSFVKTYFNFQCAADELNLVAAYAASFGSPQAPPQSSSFARSAQAPVATQPGSGQTIGLLEFDNYNLADVQDYLNFIHFTNVTGQLSEVHVAGGAGAPGSGESEVLLDIDAVIGTAPGANVVVYDGPFTGRGSFQAMFNAMINGGVTVISNSWAYCEDQTDAADVASIESILQTAAAAGITVVSGSGDHGSSCLDGSANTLHVPADVPHITAVGGTSARSSVLGAYGVETWWDSSSATVPGGQGGFGTSRFFARPAYQNGLTTSAMRSIPDVTAPADPQEGYLICQADEGGCPNNRLYGGTSVAAPIWAAFVAVLNQMLGHNVGFLNPILYPLANSGAFYSASSMGSDFAHVGLGSPNIGAMKVALSGQTVGSVVPANSSIFAFPPAVVADGSHQAGVAVLLLDSNFNTVDGQAVTLMLNAGSHATVTTLNEVTNASNGMALYTLTDTVPETVTLSASTTAGDIPQTATVTFASPPATAGGINAQPTSVTADGASTTTITVTLVDANSNPSPGKVVGLSQGNGSSQISAATAITDSTGTVAFAATDLIAEAVTYTATDITDGNLAVPGNAVVNFVNPSGPPQCNIGPGTAAPGYTITTFASGFPNSGCIGPIGLAFDLQGNLLVGDFYNGALYRFGPQGGSADPGHMVGDTGIGAFNLAALAVTKDGRLYAAEQSSNKIVELDPGTATVLRTVGNVSVATGLEVDPLSGDLFVSDPGFFCFDNPGIYRISNFASGPGTVTQYFPSACGPTFDGFVFAPDGTIYTQASYASGGNIFSLTGTNGPNPPVFTPIATVPTADGITLSLNPNSPSHPFLYVNRNDGIITKVDTTTPTPTFTDIYSGGSRGDFVITGPDGCLYVTQTDRVLKITASDGSCPFVPTTVTPGLTLSPATVSPLAQGSPLIFTATIENEQDPTGIPINLVVGGANAGIHGGTADSNGNVTFDYTGTFSGSDQVVAFATVNGALLQSNLVSVDWTAGRHTSFIGLNQSPAQGSVAQPITLTATLVDVSASPQAGLGGQTLHFDLAGQSCDASTNGSGTASCQVTPGSTPGVYELTASFAGDASFVASATTKRIDLSVAVPTPVPTPTPMFSLDNFLCYKARAARALHGQPAFPEFSPQSVTIADQFGGAVRFDAKRVLSLCAPANKADGDPTAASHPGHEEAYRIQRAKGAPKFGRTGQIHSIRNQFHPDGFKVKLGAENRLLVPTSKLLGTGGNGNPPPADLDHFKCYTSAAAKAPKGQPPFPPFVPITGVKVEDQFETRFFDLKKPTRLCNPADKNGGEPSAPSHLQHLACYAAKLTKTDPKQPNTVKQAVSTNNQLGQEVLKTGSVEELCVPSFLDQ